jgi:pimeloyl-ACP methyl ester carboxylesterase
MNIEKLNCTSYGDGPPLLIVNGLFQWRWNWDKVAKGLGKHYRCVTFDFPNQNARLNAAAVQHDWVTPHPYEDHILEVIDTLGYKPAEVRICALSWGGSLVRSLHLRRGVDFKALAMIGLPPPELNEFYRIWHSELLTLLDRHGVDAFVGTSLFWFFSHEWWAENSPAHDSMRQKMAEMFSDGDSVRALFMSAISDVDRAAPEGRFRCPTTFLTGRHDMFCPADRVQRYAAACGAHAVTTPGGHVFTSEDATLGVDYLHEALKARHVANEMTI